MPKLDDITTLLDKADNSTHIYNNVPIEKIQEFKNVFGGRIETREFFNVGSTYSFERFNVKIILHTNKYN